MKIVHSFYVNFQRSSIDLDCDLEIVTEKKSESTLKPKDDIITLSDDDASKEDDNYEIYVKVCWRSNRIDRLNMRRVRIMLHSNITNHSFVIF